MEQRSPSPKKKKQVVRGFTAFLLFVLAFALMMLFNFRTVEVKGDSMVPTFNSKDHVLVSKAYWLVGEVKRNDIVVVKSRDVPNEYYIKRVYATGGDTVDLYNTPEGWSPFEGEVEYKVPAGEYYVLGDNRPVSEDSREWGPVKLDEILGKVIVLRFGVPATQAQAKE
ncbi:MAG: signal peptidase I [Armatimonadetes bacterium]|nr:signal peptidase I [Armatimonadota bacterium]